MIPKRKTIFATLEPNYLMHFRLNMVRKKGYKQWRIYDMAGMARAMGATFRGRKNCLEKVKSFIYSFLNVYFAPHTFTNCKAASTLPLT